MKIAACQFAVTGRLDDTLCTIKHYIAQAAEQGVRLLAFPECALTGYPPRDIASPADIDFVMLDEACERLQEMINHHNLSVMIGTITQEAHQYCNTAMLLRPHQNKLFYHKRALWGWDQQHFIPGNEAGIFELDGWKIGVRICFEVRFPEFFRELYDQQTDLNVILFNDALDTDNPDRYELIRAHVRTRAVENITPTLTVNTIRPFQTAPTALYDQSGRTLAELPRNKEDMFVYEIEKRELDFGEWGRRELSNRLRKS